jgi:hypothetical protein
LPLVAEESLEVEVDADPDPEPDEFAFVQPLVVAEVFEPCADPELDEPAFADAPVPLESLEL